MFLEQSIFKDIVQYTPLISVDLIVRDQQERVLVGLRRNRPARNTWFVPGGIIQKNERIEMALQRVAQAEMGIDLAEHELRFMGVYEHIYPDNFSDDPSFGTHYVVLAHEITLKTLIELHSDGQHHEYQWLSVMELLAHEDVHLNTRAYFTDPS